MSRNRSSTVDYITANALQRKDFSSFRQQADLPAKFREAYRHFSAVPYLRPPTPVPGFPRPPSAARWVQSSSGAGRACRCRASSVQNSPQSLNDCGRRAFRRRLGVIPERIASAFDADDGGRAEVCSQNFYQKIGGSRAPFAPSQPWSQPCRRGVAPIATSRRPANISDRELPSRNQTGHLRLDVSCEDASNLQIPDVAETDVFPDRRNLRSLLPDFDVVSAVDHCLLPDGNRLVTK